MTIHRVAETMRLDMLGNPCKERRNGVCLGRKQHWDLLVIAGPAYEINLQVSSAVIVKESFRHSRPAQAQHFMLLSLSVHSSWHGQHLEFKGTSQIFRNSEPSSDLVIIACRHACQISHLTPRIDPQPSLLVYWPPRASASPGAGVHAMDQHVRISYCASGHRRTHLCCPFQAAAPSAGAR